MIRKTLHKDSAVSIPVGLAIGLGVNIVVTIIMCGIISGLMNTERIPESAENYASLITLVVASICGAIVSSAAVKQKRLPMSILSGAVYIAFLLGCTALLFEGQYSSVPVTCLVVLGSCISICFIGTGKARKSFIKKKVYR